MIIRNKESQQETFRGITLNAILVKAILINSGGAPSSSQVNFQNSQIRVVLTRNGQQHVIMQDDMKKIGLASTVDKLTQFAFATNGMAAPLNTGGALIGFIIPLGGHLNLKNDDQIYVEVINMDGLFTTDLANTSYLEVKPVKSVGYETHIPFIRSYPVQAQETSRKFDLGDNIIRASIINYDKTDFKNNVINTLTVSSDRYNENLKYEDLVLFKIDRYGKSLLGDTNPDLSSRIQEDQSFVLMDFHQQFNQVELDISFNGAQVTSGNNHIVYWTYYTDPNIIDKAAGLQAKHQMKASEAIANASATVKK
jgi:hypothetical protein